jgi:hypothetical protein
VFDPGGFSVMPFCSRASERVASRATGITLYG